MKYLEAENILFIHSTIIDETGGMHGVRNNDTIGDLKPQASQKVFGKELYPTVFLKAAVYIRNIIMNHPFVDGNKRTGMTAGGVFLANNNYVFSAQRGEIEEYALKIVIEKLTVEDIAVWLEKHVVKNKKAA